MPFKHVKLSLIWYPYAMEQGMLADEGSYDRLEEVLKCASLLTSSPLALTSSPDVLFPPVVPHSGVCLRFASGPSAPAAKRAPAVLHRSACYNKSILRPVRLATELLTALTKPRRVCCAAAAGLHSAHTTCC